MRTVLPPWNTCPRCCRICLLSSTGKLVRVVAGIASTLASCAASVLSEARDRELRAMLDDARPHGVILAGSVALGWSRSIRRAHLVALPGRSSAVYLLFGSLAVMICRAATRPPSLGHIC